MDALLEKIYRASSHEFCQYRRGAVIRRLDRRLQRTGSGNYLEYMRFLDNNPGEYTILIDYLTIHVSSFFRNAAAFEQVAGLVLPQLIAAKKKSGQNNLNFWSAACALGEEPYSIAIMLLESLGDDLQGFDVTIHATDISRHALDRARLGTYKNRQGITDSLLGRYFTCCSESYRLKQKVRRMVSFSCFDLISAKNPQIINADCIFCCNVLIYMQRQLQERALNTLYNSLAVPGYLILGETETLTDNLRGRLECLDAATKIYNRRQ